MLQKEQAIQDERKQCEQRLTRERQLKYEDKKDDNVIVSCLKFISVYLYFYDWFSLRFIFIS